MCHPEPSHPPRPRGRHLSAGVVATARTGLSDARASVCVDQPAEPMYENPPVPQDPWRYLRRTDLAQLRAAARRLAKLDWAARLPHLDAVIAEAERRGVDFLRAESCLASLGDRAFALHALVTARRVRLFWLSPVLLPWFRDDVTAPGEPPAWTVAWLAHADHSPDTLRKAGQIILAALRRDRTRGAALRPLVRALLLHPLAPRTRFLTAFVRLALEPGGRDRGPFVSKWPKAWRRRAGQDEYTGTLGTDDRALRRVVRVVMAMAPRMLVDNPTLTRAFDALPTAERAAFLYSNAVADGAALGAWAVAARARLADDRRDAPPDGPAAVPDGPAFSVVVRDPWWDAFLTNAAACVAPRPIHVDEAWPISREWITRLRVTGDRLVPWWPDALPGLTEAETTLVLHDAPYLTAAYLERLVVERPGERHTTGDGPPRPHRRDGAWRLDVLWRLAFATPDIEVGWLHERVRRELAAAVGAPRRPGWLQAWAEDARTPAADLTQALAMIEAVVGPDAARLMATRLLHVVRAVLMHPALPVEATATPLLEVALDPRVYEKPHATADFARRFAARWATEQLPLGVGVRLLRLFTETAPALLPTMPALDAAIPWMPPREWATHAFWLFMQGGTEAVRQWAMDRALGLREEDHAVAFLAAMQRAAALQEAGGDAFADFEAHVNAIAPLPERELNVLTLAPAYVPDRAAGVARLVVQLGTGSSTLALFASMLVRALRGEAYTQREGPFGGLAWTAATRRALEGAAVDPAMPEAPVPRVRLVACVECDGAGACGGGVDAEVVVDGDRVIWRDLALVHDPTVRFRGLRAYRFARDQYVQALDQFEQWAALLPATVPIPPRAAG